ncbi:MAG: hypothetical protein KDD48_08345, partial [Bdellovibrionales bacterium]|nr:hypothetical protein [Bdellovibrionales bacterium]
NESPSIPVDPLEPYDLQAFSTISASSEYLQETGQYKAKNVADSYLGIPYDHSDYLIWRPKPWDNSPWLQLEWLEPVRIHSIQIYDHPELQKNVISGNVTAYFLDGTSQSYVFGQLPDSGEAPLTLLTSELSNRPVRQIKFSDFIFERELGVSEIIVQGTRLSTRDSLTPGLNLVKYAAISDVTSTLNPHYPNTDTGDHRSFFTQDGDSDTSWVANYQDFQPSITFSFDLPYCVETIELFDLAGSDVSFTKATIGINDATEDIVKTKEASESAITIHLPNTLRSNVRRIKITIEGSNPSYFMGLMDVNILSCQSRIFTSSESQEYSILNFS